VTGFPEFPNIFLSQTTYRLMHLKLAEELRLQSFGFFLLLDASRAPTFSRHLNSPSSIHCRQTNLWLADASLLLKPSNTCRLSNLCMPSIVLFGLKLLYDCAHLLWRLSIDPF
jgi:hypothetical protein